MLYEITKENVYEILKTLAKECRKDLGRDAQVDIVLVGGGSIVLNYGFREATQDLDALLESVGSIKEAARRTGELYGLDEDWFNSDSYL